MGWWVSGWWIRDTFSVLSVVLLKPMLKSMSIKLEMKFGFTIIRSAAAIKLKLGMSWKVFLFFINIYTELIY